MPNPEPKNLFFKHIVRKVFLEDWALKLLALVITFALWFGVTGLSTPTTKRITVPLNFNISNNAEITSSPIQEVDIVISGDKRKIDQINKADLIASLDLTDVAPGDRVVSLTPENVYVQLPQGIKLTEVAPSRIAVNLEAVEEKDIEVKTITNGSVANGFEIYSTTVVPAKIRVRGPASVVKMLEYVQTDKVELADKKDDFTAKQVAVTSSNPKVSVLNTVVDVFVRIGEVRIERKFAIPVSGGKTATFVLYGPKTLLTKARSDAFKIEMTGDTPQLILPSDLQGPVEIRKLAIK